MKFPVSGAQRHSLLPGGEVIKPESRGVGEREAWFSQEAPGKINKGRGRKDSAQSGNIGDRAVASGLESPTYVLNTKGVDTEARGKCRCPGPREQPEIKERVRIRVPLARAFAPVSI